MTEDIPEPPELVVRLNGPGWKATLTVEEPGPQPARSAEFSVPVGSEPSPYRQTVLAQVRYTTAAGDAETSWPRWFVKVYHCATSGDADLLRIYLSGQAANIQLANARLPGPSHMEVDPPWAAVPVYVVRCDGLVTNMGPINTELVVTPEAIDERLRRRLPAWAMGEPPQPERFLLAISPWVDPMEWSPYNSTPATHHLREFGDLATGLDVLHSLGTVHCDIKPDNVCRYATNRVAGFVLIDTDSVVQVDPPPLDLRLTKRYFYRPLALWFANPDVRDLGVDGGILRAHDRFGFAVVVMTALAGRGWVDRVLLRNPSSLHTEPTLDEPRTADDREQLRRALRALWPDAADRHWGPLIEAVCEPFGSRAIEGDWSAGGWLQRVLTAEKECLPGRAPVVAFPRADPRPLRTELDELRKAANNPPARREDLPERGFIALDDAAFAAARKAGLLQILLWSLVALPIGVVLFVLLRLG